MAQLDDLPDVFAAGAVNATRLHRAARAGQVRRIGPRLYTKLVKSDPEQIVRSHVWEVVAAYFPGSVVTDRSAFELQPADGQIFIVAPRTRNVSLPGLKIRAEAGPPAQATDAPFVAGLYLASPARMYLDNARPSRARDGKPRRLTRAEIESRLEDDLRKSGEPYILRLRDELRDLAPKIGRQKEQEWLDSVIGTLLGTRSMELSAATAKARAAGRPYDSDRIKTFEALLSALARRATQIILAGAPPALPFFEAYFSNFIEGTEFTVDVAADIVFNRNIPPSRPADAHDVLGTYELVRSSKEMSRVPKSATELEQILRERHARLMKARPDKNPGEWKRQRNQAGNTVFVAPDLVRGTLERGFELARSLEQAFQRAAYMMFIVSEIHPFDDGNGRLARIMMNAELVAAGEQRIIIPTSYRNNYLVALKKLTNDRAPDAYIRMLEFAQRYTAAIDFSSVEKAYDVLHRTNAFIDARTADDEGKRLTMP